MSVIAQEQADKKSDITVDNIQDNIWAVSLKNTNKIYLPMYPYPTAATVFHLQRRI